MKQIITYSLTRNSIITNYHVLWESEEIPGCGRTYLDMKEKLRGRTGSYLEVRGVTHLLEVIEELPGGEVDYHEGETI